VNWDYYFIGSQFLNYFLYNNNVWFTKHLTVAVLSLGCMSQSLHQEKSISNKVAKKIWNTKYQNFFTSILIIKELLLTKNFMVEINWSWEAKIQGTSKFDYLGGFKTEVELILVEWKSTFYTLKKNTNRIARESWPMD
jgi:hypothetical protein